MQIQNVSYILPGMIMSDVGDLEELELFVAGYTAVMVQLQVRLSLCLNTAVSCVPHSRPLVAYVLLLQLCAIYAPTSNVAGLRSGRRSITCQDGRTVQTVDRRFLQRA